MFIGSNSKRLSRKVLCLRVEGEEDCSIHKPSSRGNAFARLLPQIHQLSKYTPTLVANPRSRMNFLLMGVSSFVKKECHTTMLLNDMDICRLMVYAQQIEDSKNREIMK